MTATTYQVNYNVVATTEKATEPLNAVANSIKSINTAFANLNTDVGAKTGKMSQAISGVTTAIESLNKLNIGNLGTAKMAQAAKSLQSLSEATKNFSKITLPTTFGTDMNRIVRYIGKLGELNISKGKVDNVKGVAEVINGLTSGLKRTDATNFKSITTSMGVLSNVIDKMAKKSTGDGFNRVNDVIEKLKGIGDGQFVLSVDTKGALKKVQALREAIMALKNDMIAAGMLSSDTKKEPKKGPRNTPGTKKPPRQSSFGKGGEGSINEIIVPKAYGGFQVYGGAYPFGNTGGSSQVPSGFNVIGKVGSHPTSMQVVQPYAGGPIQIISGKKNGPVKPIKPVHSGVGFQAIEKFRNDMAQYEKDMDAYNRAIGKSSNPDTRKFGYRRYSSLTNKVANAVKMGGYYSAMLGINTPFPERFYYDLTHAGQHGPSFYDPRIGNGWLPRNHRVFTPGEIETFRKEHFPYPKHNIGGWQVQKKAATIASYQQMAVEALYLESTRTIRAHMQFNEMLAANYRRAVAEAEAAATMNGGFNQFNPMPVTPGKAYRVPGWRHKNMTPAQYASALESARARLEGNRALREFQNAPIHYNGRDQGFGYRGTPAGYQAASDARWQAFSDKWGSSPDSKFRRVYGNSSYAKAQRAVRNKSNIGYKVLGPSMLDSGGLGITSMVKGMGVMYGITGLGSMFGKALRDYVEYENLMQTTKNILGSHDTEGNFNGRFAAMSHTIRDVGVRTKFTAPEVADAAKFLAMAGLKVEDINSAINPITNVALVGDTELGTTADMLTNIMTGYQIPSNQMGRAADIMTNTFTMANVTLPELAESYRYAANLLALRGVSLQESSAALGILGNAGIKGSQAGTTLRTLLMNLYKPTGPQEREWAKVTDEKGNPLVVLGKNGKVAESYITKDREGRSRSFYEIFSLLAKSIDKINPQAMFHRTASQGATALMQNVPRWTEIMTQNYLSDGLSQRLSEAKQNTLSGMWARLTSTFTEGAIQAFEGVDPTLRGALNGMIGGLGSEQGKKDIKDGISMIFGLIDALKDFSSILLGTYHRFGGFIELFLKFQLYMSAVLIPFRAFKAMLNIGVGAMTMVKTIGNLTIGVNSLTAGLQRNILQWRIFNGLSRHSGLGMALGKDRRLPNSNKIGAFEMMFSNSKSIRKGGVGAADYWGADAYQFKDKRANQAFGGMLSKYNSVDEFRAKNPAKYRNMLTHMSRYGLSESDVKEYYYSKMYTNLHNQKVAASRSSDFRDLRKFVMRRNALTPVMGGMGAMVGGGAGAYFGSMLGEEGSLTSMLGSLGGMTLGSAVGGWALGALAPAVAAVPIIGWAAAAALAIGGIGLAISKAHEKADKFAAAMQKMQDDQENKYTVSSNSYIKALITGEGELDAALDETIKKLEKRNSLLAGGSGDENNPNLNDVDKVASELLDQAENSWVAAVGERWKFTDENRHRLDPWKGRLVNYVGGMVDDTATLINPYTGQKETFEVDNTKQMSMNSIMFQRGYSQDGIYSEFINEYVKRLFKASSQSEINDIYVEMEKAMNDKYNSAVELYNKKHWDKNNLPKNKIKESSYNNIYALYGLMSFYEDMVRGGYDRSTLYLGLTQWQKVLSSNFDQNEAALLLATLGGDDAAPGTLWNQPEKWADKFGIVNGIPTDNNKLKLISDAYNIMMGNITKYIDPMYQHHFSFLHNTPFAKYANTSVVPENERNQVLHIGGKMYPFQYSVAHGYPTFDYTGTTKLPEGVEKYYEVPQFAALRNEIANNDTWNNISKWSSTPNAYVPAPVVEDDLQGGDEGGNSYVGPLSYNYGRSGGGNNFNFDINVNGDVVDIEEMAATVGKKVEDKMIEDLTEYQKTHPLWGMNPMAFMG